MPFFIPIPKCLSDLCIGIFFYYRIKTLAVRGCNIQEKGQSLHCILYLVVSGWLSEGGCAGLNLLHSEEERSSAHNIFC
jgi:hypothetical protein